MIHSQQKEYSGPALISALKRFADSGVSLIQVKTREPLRAAMILREHYAKSTTPYHEWSASVGFRTFTTENFVDCVSKGDETDFSAALLRPREELRSPTSEVNAKHDRVHFFAYHDPGAFIENNAFVLDLILQYSVILPASNVALIFITPDAPLTGIPAGLVMTTELNTPTVEELQNYLVETIEKACVQSSTFKNGHSLTDDDVRAACLLGLGLTFNEFETYTVLAINSAHIEGAETFTADHLMRGISLGKTEIVRQSEILELMTPEDMSNVGGMAKLKQWVAQRARCYSAEAAAFGIEPPKGLVLVGVPGAGKSLAAKAIASSLGVPLVRLDFARVFSKYVGDSETRVRNVLGIVEKMAPCVLFADEIDKGLGGVGSGSDSGTGQRVLGSYLTWLQELKAPVFNMVTANRVEGLPPELLRRGRFDQIFSVTMPTEGERYEVLKIHLNRRGRSASGFSTQELQAFLAASKDYVPAEIESAIKDGLVAAFCANEEFSMQHILAELRNLVPMSRSHATQLQSIIQWAQNNAIPVNDPDAPPLELAAAPPRARRMIVRPS